MAKTFSKKDKGMYLGPLEGQVLSQKNHNCKLC